MLKKIKSINIIELFIDISLFSLFFIFLTCLLSILGFLIKIPITKYHLIISFGITLLAFYFIKFKQKKFNLKKYLLSIIGFIILVAISISISCLFMDISYDGVWYHLRCITRLSNGWNPIYELINTNNWGDIFMDTYPCKGFWIFGANVLALTNNIDSTKIMSIILCFCTFSVCLRFFHQMIENKHKTLISILCSLIICLNPIFMSQLFTNYLDSSLGFLLIIYFILFASYYFDFISNDDIEFKIMIIILIALMMNLKLTGLFFAAILYLIFYLLNIKKIKKNFWKEFKNIFITGLIGVCFGLLIGINPYITNIVRGHNPFYPIIGKNSINVMGENVPKTIREKSNLEKLIVVNFSNTTNSISPYDYNFKNPLVVSMDELEAIQHDTKIGGFGPLFPLALCISIIGSLIIFYKFLKGNLTLNQKRLNILNLIILVLAIIFGESWWARYYVILWVVPVLISLSLIITNKSFYKILGYLCLIIMILNIYFVSKSVYNRQTTFSKPIMKYLKTIEGKDIEYSVTDDNFIFAYEKIFSNKNINATLIKEKENIDWDFEGINVKIRGVENEE